MIIHHVDAFTNELFKGNPACVCVSDAPLDENLMQKIAAENNLSETAFLVKNGEIYNLRWFTPVSEVDLCGHATLASAFVLKSFFEPSQNEFKFSTLSGILTVTYENCVFLLDFPVFELKEINVTEAISRAVGAKPQQAFLGRDLLLIMENESDIINAKLDFGAMLELDGLITHISAKGGEFDCVSRSFAPKLGISEDPVCGSGHCHIVPFWAKNLDKTKLKALQASARSGILECEMMSNGRVKLGGTAVLYSKNEVFV
ncbi:PhzF family phenazine biosynthesis protein [Campylobacter californiensis]|uniref:PhzF family phenazine biosynthesis protein n=1 Tax=Campylobacter californiensis TaxID=1032243 RepID=UPI0014733588|nr:PhzF family phenazine biosynthesis isomerase [Campylobacter sp. RM12916]MBE3609290.1 PhzF family phenazine biosynthesis isomerase [Campylobacter sp. RM12916]